MKSNSQLQQDVLSAIKWEPSIDASEIGITAKDRVITLSGVVKRYSDKLEVERTVKNVVGVKAVAEGITVDYGNLFKHSDTEIAGYILNGWENNWAVPADRIKLKVENGQVQLEGEVAWKYQEEASKESIIHLSGIRGVKSSIKVIAETKDFLEQRDIEDALIRNSSINSNDIKVEVNHNMVKLSGLVRTLSQKEEAGRLAWNAPGVGAVENDLAVIY